MSARFEIVRTDAEQPWHARFRAANGRIVWTTDNYTRRRAALTAVVTLVDGLSPFGAYFDIEKSQLFVSLGDPWTFDEGLEVRDIDEREVTP